MIETPLKTHLLKTLSRSGPITFERYMGLCLYHPEYGYYMQTRDRSGVRGDYFTSSDLHPVFARLVARQAVEIWELLGHPSRFTWVEMGAGRGWFARDFLEWAERQRPDFAASLEYVVIEPSAAGQAQVLERVKSRKPSPPGTDADSPPQVNLRVIASLKDLDPVVGCFFSNELVDAFPVSVVTRAGGRLREVYVAIESAAPTNEALREKLGSISDSAIAASVARYAGQLEEGHRVEVNLHAVRWMKSVAEKLSRGFVITIDYGDLAERLCTAARARGTLLAYRGHTASENFFDAPGEQDLTSHVNFSALIDTGREAGLTLTGFVTQEQFLMALGEADQFADLYDPGQSEVERLEARTRLKRLIFPGEPDGPEGMGSIFKVLVQQRGVAAPQLTGLRYDKESDVQT